jgi:phosphocarrier protein
MVIERVFAITNKAGLHARAAALLVQCVSKYQAQVTITKDGEEVNGKSIMGVMMLAAVSGSEISARFEGPDAEAAAAALADLVGRRFDEE